MPETDSVPPLDRILSKQFIEFVRLRYDVSTTLPVPAFVAALNAAHATVTINALNVGDVPAAFVMQGSNADPIDYNATVRIPASAAGGNVSDQLPFELSGDLQAGTTFGYWIPSAMVSLIGAQVSAQDAPTGSDVILEVYKNGSATGKTVTLSGGDSVVAIAFPSSLLVNAGDTVTLHINQVGSTTPGSFVTVILTYNNSTAASPDGVVWTTTIGEFSSSFVNISGTDQTVVPGGTVNFAFDAPFRFIRLLPTADGGRLRIDGTSSSGIAIVATDPQLRN